MLISKKYIENFNDFSSKMELGMRRRVYIEDDLIIFTFFTHISVIDDDKHIKLN